MRAIRQPRIIASSSSVAVPSLIKPSLGSLEYEVLQQVSLFGESTARQVLERIGRPLAYTTVMTTLTRLYRKGFLSCRASGKRFFYTSRLSSKHLEMQLARDLVKALVACEDVQIQELAVVIVEVTRRERPQLFRELRQAMHEDAGDHRS